MTGEFKRKEKISNCKLLSPDWKVNGVAMFHVRHIDSLGLPELAPYRTMRRHVEHARERIFVAEGDKVVRRLLESDLAVISLLIQKEWLVPLEPLLKARTEDIPVYVAPKAELEKLTGFPLFQGVLAVGRFPEPAPLERILAASRRPRLLVALEGLTNSENMGVLVRNCAAFGVQVLIIGETCSSPFLRRAVRNSMGAVFKLPVVEVSSLVATLRELRRSGFRCIAAHPHTEQVLLPQCDLTQDCCIVLGSEGYGLSQHLLESCDQAVAIPMTDEVDSLNVSNAGAVFLYEANRQRVELRKLRGE